jgi:MoxR-like ATPase
VKRTVDFGAGVRAGQFLVRAGQAFAAMEGRFSVSIDDIRKAAEPVLRHRIGANFQAQAEGKQTEDIVRQLLETIPEPDVAKYSTKTTIKRL